MRFANITSRAGAKSGSATREASAFTRKRPRITLGLALVATALLAGCATESPKQLTKVDQVIVKKSERKMELIQDGEVLREYRIALGDQPRGHKMQQGDERTPEGDYILDWRNPNSRFYKSIHVSYPNERDTRFARFHGRGSRAV